MFYKNNIDIMFDINTLLKDADKKNNIGIYVALLDENSTKRTEDNFNNIYTSIENKLAEMELSFDNILLINEPQELYSKRFCNYEISAVKNYVSGIKANDIVFVKNYIVLLFKYLKKGVVNYE